jgi:hypothetical protein
LYTVQERHARHLPRGYTYIYLSVRGNEGWFHPVMYEGKLVQLHGEGWMNCDSQIEFVSPKQRAKIERAVEAAGEYRGYLNQQQAQTG